MSRSTVNRALLGAVGLVLLCGGLLVLAGGLDLYGRLGVGLPHHWPLRSPDQPVVSTASRTRWTDRSWWWPTVIAVLSVVVLGALGWLTAQLRRSGPGSVPIPGPPGTDLRLRSSALEDVVETGTIAHPEVTRARTRLTGRRRSLLLRTTVRLAPAATPAPVLTAYQEGPLADTRASLALPGLPSELRITVQGRSGSRSLR
ncbi:alkaline shock response membrane anchor protein AmaP [Kitasatospora sp. McL0602]|uniref:alkaline shock response membrane anchor protein AmaP n=1 Tax=Kitasatospora sp. McL0602 TaxID=3439530 RepID=UPI003F8A3616